MNESCGTYNLTKIKNILFFNNIYLLVSNNLLNTHI